jgi:hypothetical protein
MRVEELTDKQLGIVDRGADPIQAIDRRVYYGHVADLLDGCALPTNHGIRDIVQMAQGRSFRRPSRPETNCSYLVARRR